MWTPRSTAPALPSGEIHVWRASLEPSGARFRALSGLLASDEHERANAFLYRRDRERFVIARGILRIVLSLYLARDPAGLRFRYAVHGKPALADDERVAFNLSHSREVLLVAVKGSGEIGVDVEGVRADLEIEKIAAEFFSPAEAAMLRALAPNERPLAFATCWTRKEAVLKASGDGLSVSVDRFTASGGLPDAAGFVAFRPGGGRQWTLRALTPAPRFVGAVAAAGDISKLRCWEWSG